MGVVTGEELIAASDSVWEPSTVFLSSSAVVIRLSGTEVCAGCFACCFSRAKLRVCACAESDIEVPFDCITGVSVVERPYEEKLWPQRMGGGPKLQCGSQCMTSKHSCVLGATNRSRRT